jgi:simple sugar transport system permease protein
MTMAVMAVSGGLAGVAGAVEVSAVTKGLEPKALAIELGYTGIIIAAVARLNPLGVVPVAVFLAAIATSGSSLQGIGVPIEIVVLLQGLIFLSVTAGEFFVTNRVRLANRTDAGPATPPEVASDPAATPPRSTSVLPEVRAPAVEMSGTSEVTR